MGISFGKFNSGFKFGTKCPKKPLGLKSFKK